MQPTSLGSRGYLYAIAVISLLFLFAGVFIGVERSYPVLIFSLSNLLLLVTALSLKERFFASCHGVDSLLVCLTLYIAILVLGLTILGFIHLLSLRNAFIVFLGLFLLTSSFRCSWVRHCKTEKLFRTIAGFAHKERLLFIIVLTLILILVSYRIYTPPASYDDLVYHLTQPVEWFKSGNLSMPLDAQVPLGYPWASHFPFNGQLLLFWLLIPLRSDFLAKFGQTLFVFLTIATVFALTKRVGMSREAGICSCLLALVLPKFLLQGIFRSGNDIMFTFFFLSCLNFLLLLQSNYSVANTVSFSVTFGLLLGTKSLGLTYGSPLFLYFLYILFIQKRRSFPSMLKALSVSIVIILALGGTSYARNLLATGNPFYPLRVAIGKVLLFDGPIEKEILYKKKWVMILNPFEDYPALAFIMVSSAITGFLSLRRTHFRPKVLLVAGIAFYITVNYLLGFQRNTRYLYPVMMLSVVTSCWAAVELGARYRHRLLRFIKLIVYAFLIFILWDFFTSRTFSLILLWRGLIAFCVLLFLTALAIVSFSMMLRCRRAISVSAAILLAAISIFCSIWYILEVRDAYDRTKYSAGEWLSFSPCGVGNAWKWVDEHSGPEALTIAYSGFDNCYPFYGKGLKNNVVFVPRGTTPRRSCGLHVSEENCLVHVYTIKFLDKVNNLELDEALAGSFGWNYDLWVDNLTSEDVDWVVIRKAEREGGKGLIQEPIENEWAISHPEDFRLIYSQQSFRIYERIL